MKGVHALKPTHSNVQRSTWDAAEVLSLLQSWGIPSKLTFAQLTGKLATLCALYSARRVSDLVLLSISPENLIRSKDKIVLYCSYGAKQDRIGHINPPITLHAFKDKSLCPIAHLERYLTVTKKRRKGDKGQSLFLIKVFPYGPAKIFTIRNWIVDVLKQAGVKASAGSTRAAAATYAATSNISLQRILEAADWARASTMYKFYVKSLPPEILQRIRWESDMVFIK